MTNNTAALNESDINAAKAEFRAHAKAIRAQAYTSCSQAGERIAEHLASLDQLRSASLISGFWPLTQELDTRPVMNKLHQLGHQMLLPIMQGAGKPLLFGAWQPGDVLVEAAFKTLEPSADQPQHVPQVMLTPLLAFDRRGYRMGYGGGFYDRSIAQIRAQNKRQQATPLLCIGLAFSDQEVDTIITGPYDLPLDMVVTEQGVIHCCQSNTTKN